MSCAFTVWFTEPCQCLLVRTVDYWSFHPAVYWFVCDSELIVLPDVKGGSNMCSREMMLIACWIELAI